MGQLTFWIVTADASRGKKWETLLMREGWQVGVLGSFEALSADAAEKRFGIALADWELNRARTPDALKKLKGRFTGVSAVLVSDPGLNPDQVIGALEAGADDHFINTVDDKLLVAKLKAHLRRILPSLAAALDVLKSPGGEVKLDRSMQQAWLKGTRGRWVPISGLTRTEFRFLTLFLEQPGKVLERHYILENVKQGDYTDIRPGTVDKHVESLRRKLGRFSSMIRTVYGESGDLFRKSDEARWHEAATAGLASDFIEALPDGYHTQLGTWFKGGRELSIGQWQKIALSRAFMRKDADVMVLDEPVGEPSLGRPTIAVVMVVAVARADQDALAGERALRCTSLSVVRGDARPR